MKFYAYLIAIAALCYCSLTASAEKLIYEPFDYAAGTDLLGLQNTSSGWAASGNTWLRAAPVGSEANSLDIAATSLTGPSDLKASIGNSLSIFDGSSNGAADRLAIRSAGTTITSGTVYYSFLLRVDSLLGSNNGVGDYFLSLNNTANTATANNPTVAPGRMLARIDPNDATKFSLGMFTNRTPTSVDDGWVDGLTVGDTMFVVGAYNVGAGTANSTKLWINPDPLSFGLATPPVTFSAEDTTGASNGGTVGSFLFHQRNAAPDLTLDELRVGTLWSDVTPLGAPTLYWDIDGSTAGSGGATPSGIWDGSTTNWNESAAGDDAAQLWSSGSGAVFSAGTDATGAYTITVSGTQSASQVTFEDGTPTLTGGTLDLTGALHTITTNSGVTANIDSVVGGSVGFIKNGAGTLVLTANETYSGTTTISGGTLQVGNGGTTGTLPTASAIADNGTIAFNQSDAVVQGTDFSGSAITGTGGLTQAGSGTLTLNAANTYSGSTRAGSGTLRLANSLAVQNSTLDMDGADAGAVSFDSSLSAVTLGGFTGSRNLSLLNSANGALAVTVGSSASPAPYSGVLSGGGSSLTKIGTGTQVLSGANTYGGGTTINDGILQFSQTVSMPASGAVTVNSGGTLAVNAGGAGEWTDSTDDTVGGTIGGIITGRGGQGTANQVTWMAGSAFAIDTTNAPGAPSAPDLTYDGVIGGFRTTGGGTTDAVGFTKRGLGTLTLNGNHTFSGPLTVLGGVNSTSTSTLILNGTALNAGTTTAIPTVGIGGFSNLQLTASERLPAGSLINTLGAQAKLHLNDDVTQTIRSLSGTNGVIEVGLGRLNIVDQAGDDYTLGTPGGAYIQSFDGVFDPNRGTIYKTGAGTLTLMGDAGTNFNGTFFMENGTLKLSRNQALGSGGSGRLVVKGGQLARSNTPTGNFTYALAFLDLHVFRYDLSDDAVRTSQFGAATVTTLKEDEVEFNITNAGVQTGSSGRFNFLSEIRNHDPNPLAGDDTNAIRGIRKTGNGVLGLLNNNNSYLGSTTVEDGVLLTSATSTIGDYNQATIGTVNLKGGLLATADNRTDPIKNPINVDGNGAIGFFGSGGQTSVVMEFDNNSIVGTSGSLTVVNANSNTSTSSVFQPRFTGSGFNFARPIVISGAVTVGTGVKSSELQGGNTTGTQTFSGSISGGGSLRRVNAGGQTVLSGANTYTGGTFVDDGTLTASGSSATFGSGNVTVAGGVLSIVSGVANAIANAATLSIASPGMVSLGGGINETLAGLVLDGIAQANGTYGSTASAATFQNDTYFSGAGILTIAPAVLPGDYNNNGVVDAADYVLWRKSPATYGGDPAGYTTWRANFGNTAGAGSGGGLGAGAVPEPSTLALFVFAIGSTLIGSSRRRRS